MTTPAYRLGKGVINAIGAHFSYNSQHAQKWSYVPADPTAFEAATNAGRQHIVIEESVFVEQLESSITVSTTSHAIAGL